MIFEILEEWANGSIGNQGRVLWSVNTVHGLQLMRNSDPAHTSSRRFYWKLRHYRVLLVDVTLDRACADEAANHRLWRRPRLWPTESLVSDIAHVSFVPIVGLRSRLAVKTAEFTDQLAVYAWIVPLKSPHSLGQLSVRELRRFSYLLLLARTEWEDLFTFKLIQNVSHILQPRESPSCCPCRPTLPARCH